MSQLETKNENSVFILIWFVCLTAVFYFSSLKGSFHFDDVHVILDNAAVHSWRDIPSFWTDSRTSSFIPENRVYRPLTYTFYSICWGLGGGETWPFHILKMVLHAFVGWALFLIWTILLKTPHWIPVRDLRLRFPLFSKEFSFGAKEGALGIATLFVIHPACSECLNYISATSSLQCAFFYIWAYFFYLKSRSSKKWEQLLAGLFLYFCSVASKEEGITLPATVLLTELFLLDLSGKRKFRRAVLSAFPFIVMGVFLGIWLWMKHSSDGDVSRGSASSFEYFITQWRAYLWYFKLWFWPWGLNADYASVEFSRSLLDPLVIQAALGNLGILTFAWFLRKRLPVLLFSLGWFYLTISPASSLVVLAEAMNEHRMYLAYAGFAGGACVLFLYAIEGFLKATEDLKTRSHQVALGLGVFFYVLVLGAWFGTNERNQVWANEENLWKDTLEKNPYSGRAMNNLGLVYLQRGEYSKSMEYLKRCEKVWSTYLYCPLNLGLAHFALGKEAFLANRAEEAQARFKDAESAFARAHEFGPDNVHVNFHLGRFAEEVKNSCEKASSYYLRAIELTRGRNPPAETRLALCYKRLHRVAEAKDALRHVLSIDPLNEMALFEKGKLEIEEGQIAEAIQTFLTFTQTYPENWQGIFNLGLAYIKNSDHLAAKERFSRLVELDPGNLGGWFHLANSAEKTGDGSLAIRAIRKLVELNPGNSQFQNRRVEIEKKFGENRS